MKVANRLLIRKQKNKLVGTKQFITDKVQFLDAFVNDKKDENDDP